MRSHTGHPHEQTANGQRICNNQYRSEKADLEGRIYALRGLVVDIQDQLSQLQLQYKELTGGEING